jgi:hypothetical protein
VTSLERLSSILPAEAPPAPLRGRRYNEDRLHLLVRDPRRVFAIWEISSNLSRVVEERARVANAPVRYRIWIERITRQGDQPRTVAAADLPDALGGEGWYLDLPASGGLARAVLGIDLPQSQHALLVSRWVPVPPDHVCAEEGTWEIGAVGAAWLERQAAGGHRNVPDSAPSSASRYLDPPRPS